MDCDCVSTRSECARVTSTEQSQHEAGNNVDVHLERSETVRGHSDLECRKNTPHSLALIERCALKLLGEV